MAHSPASRPDPFEPRESPQPVGRYAERTEEASAVGTLQHYLSALSASGGGSLSADVALDLVLNEIVGCACHATGASSGGIALARDGEMVCRATTGENAPDIGARLNTRYGLSGACLRTGEGQLCSDTENDSRVDPEICCRLGVRSILVVPVRLGEELIGVVEVFSVKADAFTDRDIQILQGYAREVSENVDAAAKLQTSEPGPSLAGDAPDLQNCEPVIAFTEPGSSDKALPQKDFATTALLACVILLAVILGWMLGRDQWRRRAPKSVVPPSHAVQSQLEASVSDSTSLPPVASTKSENSSGISSDSGTAAEDTAEHDGLVVSRNGKVIFRDSSRGSNQGESANSQAAEQRMARPRLRIAPEIAEGYLAARVEPGYPEQAKRRRIQGPVVIETWIDKAGMVRNVIPISGNPELRDAAARAVAQWRFRPFFHQGQPEAFTTRVSLEFRLP